MQGLHVFDPRAVVAVDLESLVHHDHFLRKVDRLLETSFIRELTTACYVSGLGRPSIDPEVFFRMLLVAFLYDIRSDRQLCEDVHHNVAYRWFCRLALHDKVPDHSSLSRIRDRSAQYVHDYLAAIRPLKRTSRTCLGHAVRISTRQSCLDEPSCRGGNPENSEGGTAGFALGPENGSSNGTVP